MWEMAVEIRSRYPEMPIFVDPSHMAGKREFLQELSQKAMNLGFEGLMIESHCNPDVALSDAGEDSGDRSVSCGGMRGQVELLRAA